MKVTIPQELKDDVPQTTWGKVLSATPVVMAVVSTMLAGLSSSEMTRAQYDRSLAAQQQSKAGDQWSFFQAKRLRGALQKNTVDLLEANSEVQVLDPQAFQKTAEAVSSASGNEARARTREELAKLLNSATGKQALVFLQTGGVPAITASQPVDPGIRAALEAIEALKPASEIIPLLWKLDDKTVESALHNARDQAQDFDLATKPINQAIDQFEVLMRQLSVAQREPSTTAAAPSTSRSALEDLTRALTAARLRYAAVRYEVEARLNQGVANLYELQVRKSNLSAERHHARSQRFFLGMLAAQLGVIISTFAIAAKKRNLLWSLAAGAGVLAIAFATYVYLYV